MSNHRALRQALLLFALATTWSCAERDSTPSTEPTLATRLGTEDTVGFARATVPRPFDFPADHGPHPEFRNEWWYFIGNLATENGRRFGYQVTFFRIALTSDTTKRRSAWSTRAVWMAHVAVSDAERKSHVAQERFVRGAAGLAGAVSQPLRLWLEDWEIRHAGEDVWRIRVEADEFTLALNLTAVRDIVLQGDNGLSRKSTEPGNASYYYSIPRLQTQGEITLGAETFAVSGMSWLDREWSTSALAADQEGWDWFAVQFNDGRDLMFYRLRRVDGTLDPLSSGTLSAPGAAPQRLGYQDIELIPTRWWQPSDGQRYPVAWQMRMPDGQRLRVEAVFDDQYMDLSVRYWEGMVEVFDDRKDSAAVARGYLELAGY